MRTPIVSVKVDTSTIRCAEMMIENNISSLVIRDGTSRSYLTYQTIFNYTPFVITQYHSLDIGSSPLVPITMKSTFSLSAYSTIEHVIDIEGRMRTEDMPDTVKNHIESKKSNSKVLPLL
jgi:hypothetical protein